MRKQKLLIGSHVSLKAPKYLLGSLEESLSYEANAFMIYTGAPQNTVRVDINKFGIQEFKDACLKNNFNMDNIVVHAPYIFNPANINQRDYAIDFLTKEITRTHEIGSKILVLHPGAHVGQGYEEGIKNSAYVINKAISNTKDLNVIVAIETMAGKGTEIGYTFEQVREILNLIENKDRVKVCMDTCHIHDAGYDIINDLDNVMDQFDKIVGFDNVVAVHINDSKNQRFARKDRHENIGKGFIGTETLIKFIYYPKFNDIPFILETPYIHNIAPYKEEIALIRSLEPK